MLPSPEERQAGERADRLPAGDTQDLVLAARAGDSARFAELYERLAPALFAWAQIRIRSELKPWLEPQDLVQEVWCRAWRSFPSFDPAERTGSGAFRYWIFRIAKHVLLEAVRESRSPTFRAGSGSTTRLFALREVPDSVTAASRRLARSESLERFARWMQDLDEEDRRLVVHCGLEGMRHDEVAARLQLSTAAVDKRWQRLRSRVEAQREPRELLALLE
jgi:RNA polymerase sigma-70 factor, ECF subfamily